MLNVLLQMKYHPVKRMVEFKRYENGREIPITGGRLQRYMNQKGKFVLRDYGKEFLNDIAKVFDPIEKLEINVIMPKTEYIYFEQMIRYYNNDFKTRCEMHVQSFLELPDINETVTAVKRYGENVVEILRIYNNKLLNICELSNETMRNIARQYIMQIDIEVEKIENNLNSVRAIDVIELQESDDEVEKAFELIDSINSTVLKLICGMDSLRESNREDIKKIQKRIERLCKEINQKIDTEYKRRIIGQRDTYPEELNVCINRTLIELGGTQGPKFYKELKLEFNRLLYWRDPKCEKINLKRINDICEEVTLSNINGFKKVLLQFLRKEKDDFLGEIKKIISQSGGISEYARKKDFKIPNYKIQSPYETERMLEIYNNRKYIKGILKKEYLDKMFIVDIYEDFTQNVYKVIQSCYENYKKSHNIMMLEISKEITNNLSEYSLKAKKLVICKDMIRNCGKIIIEISDALVKCEEKLNETIWMNKN